MDKEKRIAELRLTLETSPGGPDAIELVQLLASETGTRPEAREVCFRTLAGNPRQPAVRLLLAKLFYLDRLTEFSVRELLELKKYTKSPALDKLLEAFGDLTAAFGSGEKRDKGTDREEVVLAEADVEVDFSEALDDLSGKG